MRGTTIGRIVLLVGALALSGCSYNRLVGLRENIDAAWAQVENQLQRRNDLIPNLVEVTKGYAAHEKEIFEAVANARSRLLAAGTRDEKIDAATGLDGALGRLLAIAERYPDLKANANFLALQEELTGTESKIAYARQYYNDQVRLLNTAIQSFPSSVLANMFHFSPREFFDIEDAVRAPVQVDFEGQ